jgi:hypothetical protein
MIDFLPIFPRAEVWKVRSAHHEQDLVLTVSHHPGKKSGETLRIE